MTNKKFKSKSTFGSMGICSSCEAVATTATAKVIFPDGHLQEYAGSHVRVSQLLSKETSCFVCNADDMEFEGYVSALGDDVELQPGQIYFVLPASVLRRRLHREDMAALAVRASSALVKNGTTVVSFDVADGGTERSGMERNGGRRRRTGSGGRGRNFSSDLGAIPE